MSEREGDSVTVSGGIAANSSGRVEMKSPVVVFTEKEPIKAPVAVVVPSTKGRLVPESCSCSDVMSAAEMEPVLIAESGAVMVALKLPPMPVGGMVVNW